MHHLPLFFVRLHRPIAKIRGKKPKSVKKKEFLLLLCMCQWFQIAEPNQRGWAQINDRLRTSNRIYRLLLFQCPKRTMFYPSLTFKLCKWSGGTRVWAQTKADHNAYKGWNGLWFNLFPVRFSFRLNNLKSFFSRAYFPLSKFTKCEQYTHSHTLAFASKVCRFDSVCVCWLDGIQWHIYFQLWCKNVGLVSSYRWIYRLQ